MTEMTQNSSTPCDHVRTSALSAISPLGTSRGGVEHCIHDDHDLRIVEDPFLSVLSLRLARPNHYRHVIGELLAERGLALPDRPAQLIGTPELSCAWIEPNAWIVTSIKPLAPNVNSIASTYVTDVSDRTCAFRLTRERALDVIAAGCDPAIVACGSCTRVRFGGLTAVIIQCWAAHEWRLLVDVSHAHTVAAWLKDAALNMAADNS